MTVTLSEIRPGTYYDSVVLMQLQRSLAELDGIDDAGVVMATPANCDLLAASDLPVDSGAGPDDLLIVVKAESEQLAADALGMVDQLIASRRKSTISAFHPRSLAAAAKQLPNASLVSISVPGRFAAGVAHQSLDLGKHVFIYSDNVSIDDEAALKNRGVKEGLLVMGPDCGTAIIGGVGLGFANRVRKGSIGLVGASGTGIQAITSLIHKLGGGISHAVGTGGRDLKKEIGALTTKEGLRMLAADKATSVIVLVSKPPEPVIAAQVLEEARSISKPIVVNLIGLPIAMRQSGNLHFATNMTEAAELAVSIDGSIQNQGRNGSNQPGDGFGSTGYLRALFSGGTLAYETILNLQAFLIPLYTNIPVRESQRLPDINRSQGHSILDMGEDDFTQGRLHPMMDNDLRVRRMLKEAEDPEVSVIFFDVVLGEGAHPDPASQLSHGVNSARKAAGERPLNFIALVVGTDEDPQDMDEQEASLRRSGVEVYHENSAAVSRVLDLLGDQRQDIAALTEPELLRGPLAVINVGLELFNDSLQRQGAETVHVDWRPPAGGNEDLMTLLARMKSA